MVRRQIEMRQRSGGIKEDRLAAEARETAHLKHDGELVAAALPRFYCGEDRDID